MYLQQLRISMLCKPNNVCRRCVPTISILPAEQLVSMSMDLFIYILQHIFLLLFLFHHHIDILGNNLFFNIINNKTNNNANIIINNKGFLYIQ